MTEEIQKQGYKIIESQTDLENLVDVIKGEKSIAVDLEADSMYNFREKVCLIQIATQNCISVIDPLKVQDLSLLTPIFSNPNIKKIFHGADYDVRSLYRDYRFEINNLFDTELACRFLGIKETGLNTVLKNRFNVEIDKRFQKKDWSRRPLPEEMVDYAARDVIYLEALSQVLEEELIQKGRFSWVTEECEHLSKVRHVPNGYPLFLKFRGAGRLDRESLGVLETLLRLRIRIARRKNMPVFKIISNGSLMTLAKRRPLSVAALMELHALSPKQINMYGKALMKSISKASKLPYCNLPLYPRKKPPILKPTVPARIKALKSWRDERAEELDIDPSMLFNKAMLTAIAAKKPKTMQMFENVKNMRNWQKDEFGEEIIEVLGKVK